MWMIRSSATPLSIKEDAQAKPDRLTDKVNMIDFLVLSFAGIFKEIQKCL